MTHLRKIPVLAVLALGATLPAPAAHAATAKKAPAKPKAPLGVVVAAKDLKTVGTVSCARIGGTWYAGTRTKAGRFLTFKRQAANARSAARTLKGAARTKKLAAARRYDRKAGSLVPYCKLRPAVVGQPLPSSVPWGPGYVAPPTAPVRFDLTGAAGIALRDPSMPLPATRATNTGVSNLAVVDGAGRLREALVSGTVQASRFLIAPNDRLFVLFVSPTPLAPDGPSCLLAEVGRQDGVPTCVDSTLASVWWDGYGGGGAPNPAVQFDDRGGVYYLGGTVDGRTVLRRFSGGVRTDLITDNASVSDFLVLGDGTVLLTGSTSNTQAPWLRRIAPGGALRTLRASAASFLRRFPDGNVYFGVSVTGDYGVRRYLASSDEVDPPLWIGPGREDGLPPRNDSTSLCYDWVSNQGFCSSTGTWISKAFTTLQGKVFVIAGGGSTGQLVQYFPTLARPTTAVTKVAVAQGVLNHVVLSGVGAHERNVTTLYDTTDGSERVLIGPDAEVEVYHLNYRADDNRILFDGLRFADNTYVLGQIDLDTGAVTTTATTARRLQAFQTFR
ncbi:hypothetical protein [Paraconexibacter algicola]|uniref:Uncharacterized protein n=1 Tax=Paraconexibacter algicola TaxID=2133960 RepID=A0A2T4UG51_9ACTN|nr:hypothetical protein [Paraconexibacter algicola]PTL58221.1 hypothetical protein C7Y72_00445 [Paraconexibacter algicola]